MSVVRWVEKKKRFRFDGRGQKGERIQKFFRAEDEAKEFKSDFDRALEGYVRSDGKGHFAKVNSRDQQRAVNGIAMADAIRKYHDLAGPKKSENTRKQDRIYLGKFYEWLYEVREVYYSDELDSELIETYQTNLIEKGLAESTINREFVTIKHFLSKCFRWKLTTEDLSDAVSLLSVRPSEKPKAWTEDQFEVFQNEAPLWVTEVLRVMDETGLRPFQVAALKFKDVDLERRRYRTVHKKGGHWIDSTLPASDRFIEMVNRRRQRNRFINSSGPEDFIFLNSKNRPITANALGIAIRKVREAKGLPKITAYGVRHKFGSDLGALDVGLKKIATLMTHARTTTTEDYVQAKESNLRDALKAKNAQNANATRGDVVRLKPMKKGIR
jgi:integrase/recombinase XerC